MVKYIGIRIVNPGHLGLYQLWGKTFYEQPRTHRVFSNSFLSMIPSGWLHSPITLPGLATTLFMVAYWTVLSPLSHASLFPSLLSPCCLSWVVKQFSSSRAKPSIPQGSILKPIDQASINTINIPKAKKINLYKQEIRNTLVLTVFVTW